MHVGTKSIAGVEIFRTGRWNGREYTGKDLDYIVESYTALAPTTYEAPGKLGHNEEQQLTDGQPAVGWVTRVYRKGNSLFADFKDVPETLAKLIEAGGYRKRSCELLFNVKLDDKVWPVVLKAVSWLGADMPAVKGMTDVMEFYSEQARAEALSFEFERAESFAFAFGAETRVDLIDDSFDDIRQCICDALDTHYPFLWDYSTGALLPGADADAPSPSVRDIYKDRVIVWNQTIDSLWAIPYTIEGTTCVLAEPYKVRVQYLAEPQAAAFADKADAVPTKSSLLAQLQAMYDGLDTAGKGKTGITSLRAFLRESMKALKAMKIADDAEEGANNADDNDAESATSTPTEGNDMPFTIEELRTLCNLGDDADETAVRAHLVATTAAAGAANLSDFANLTEKVTSLEAKLADRDADDAVVAAIKAGKIVPAMKDWGKKLALSDRASFDLFVSTAPKQVNFSEQGSSDVSGADGAGAGGDTPATREVSDTERQIARTMGVSEAKLSDKRPLSVKLAEAQAAASK